MPGRWYTDRSPLDAWRGRVVTRTLSDLDARSGDWIALGWHPASEARGIESDDWLVDQIGRAYDWGGAVGTGVLQLRRWQHPGHWYCSELSAARAAMAGALTVSPYIRGVMPTQCADLLIAAGAVLLDKQALLAGEVTP